MSTVLIPTPRTKCIHIHNRSRAFTAWRQSNRDSFSRDALLSPHVNERHASILNQILSPILNRPNNPLVPLQLSPKDCNTTKGNLTSPHAYTCVPIGCLGRPIFGGAELLNECRTNHPYSLESTARACVA